MEIKKLIIVGEDVADHWRQKDPIREGNKEDKGYKGDN